MIRKAIAAAVIFLSFPALGFSYDLYVNSSRAIVYSAPDIASGRLFELTSGTRMSGVVQKGYWHKVEYQGQKGWVYKFQVKKTPPVSKQDVYGTGGPTSEEYETFSDRARRRPSAYTAAAAARGLKQMRRRFSSQYHLDYEALGKMESINLTNDQAMNFLVQGVSNEKRD